MKKLQNFIEDILIFLGMFLIVLATFLINFVAGLYVLGTFLLSLGIFFSIKPPVTRRR